MQTLDKYKLFIKGNKTDFTALNLSYMIFENIDFEQYFQKDGVATSFFRCDFRGTTFKNVNFYKNIFDRADFISCSFINCRFDSVDFGRSQTKNCYFYNVYFINNNYSTNTLQQSTYEKCIFVQEKILSNLNDCVYNSCTFEDCDFNRSSAENLAFNFCSMNNINLATLHAECFSFDNCFLENIQLDMSYIFGYFITKTDLNHVQFLYRGKKQTLEDIQHYAIELWSGARYSEFFNSFVILRKIQDLPLMLSKILKKIKEIQEFNQRIEIQKIFDAIIYYMQKGALNFDIIYTMTNYINNEYDISVYPYEIKMVFASSIYKITYLLETYDFEDSFYTSKSNIISYITFCCNTDDYNLAINSVSKFLKEVDELCGQENNYILYHSEKGSWFLTFAVSSLIALLIIRIVRNSVNIRIELKLKNKLADKLVQTLDDAVSVDDVKKITEIANAGNLLGDSISSTNINDDIKSLAEIVRNINVGL